MKQKWCKKSHILSLIFTFLISTFGSLPNAKADEFVLPKPGTMVALSTNFSPAIITGMTIHPENPLQFDFIVDTGDNHLQAEVLKSESNKLINYFMATLTVPDDEMWVNLSPYEKNRIIADGLSKTEMGRDMLAQDYILKQLTASLIYPESSLGKEFWKKIYTRAEEQFGTTQIPINLFNKVWIIPQDASVYVRGNSVFVTNSHLKVMLEEDYLSLDKHTGISNQTKDNKTHTLGSQVVREIVLPALEKEVNSGKNFANLRQIYNSMILATWYKKKLHTSLFNQIYLNKNKTNGIELADKTVKDKIYQQYLQAYKKGVFNFIKDDLDPQTQVILPKKYFSGGLERVKNVNEGLPSADWISRQNGRKHVVVREIGSLLKNNDKAMLQENDVHQEIVDGLFRMRELWQQKKIDAVVVSGGSGAFLALLLSQIGEGDENFPKVYYLNAEQNINLYNKNNELFPAVLLEKKAILASVIPESTLTNQRFFYLDDFIDTGDKYSRLKELFEALNMSVQFGFIASSKQNENKEAFVLSNSNEIFDYVKSLAKQVSGFVSNDSRLKDLLIDKETLKLFRLRLKRQFGDVLDSFREKINEKLSIMKYKARQQSRFDEYHQRISSALYKDNLLDEDGKIKDITSLNSINSNFYKNNNDKFGTITVYRAFLRMKKDGLLPSEHPVSLSIYILRFLGFINDSLWKDFLKSKEKVTKLSDKTVVGVDEAMASTRGGIDFNANNMNLKEQGSSIDFSFKDLINIQADKVNGILPVIINIQPVNLGLLIGIKGQENKATPI